MFKDRSDAGHQLASRLLSLKPERPVVYALPRGGIPVAVPIAKALKAPLELIMVRKIGAPGAPEVALGAISEDSDVVLNMTVRRLSAASDDYLERTRSMEADELARRRRVYLGDHVPVDPAGCSAILVDDGLATGATMKAALAAVRRFGVREVIVAVPVGPEPEVEEIGKLADRIICLHAARAFSGVSAFYRDFHQLEDDDVVGMLSQAWSGTTPAR